ncbi:hypothetical protein AB1Y20_010183 [Prymnesium parvum]|uniref:Phosphatidylethanolamine-binding protein n=1 Tax=Prymnesium parvum TaxID=97485 RepID=A0AB34K469_PRYPA
MAEGLRPLRVPLLREGGTPHRSHRIAILLSTLIMCACILAVARSWRAGDLLFAVALRTFLMGRDDYNACGRAKLSMSLGATEVECGDAIEKLLSAESRNEALEQPPLFSFSSAEERSFYSLAIMNLDAPSSSNPSEREYRHLLVGNLLGGELKRGNVTQFHQLTPWEPPKAVGDSGPHRFVLLLFSEYGPSVNFEPIPADRARWNAQDWADGYGFGPPVASSLFILD